MVTFKISILWVLQLKRMSFHFHNIFEVLKIQIFKNFVRELISVTTGNQKTVIFLLY
jgi:hypothetical protein